MAKSDLARGAKSSAVREYCAAHPEAGPTAVVKALAEKNIAVTAALVSNIKNGPAKTKAKKSASRKARKAAKAVVKSNAFTLDVNTLLKARAFTKECGGFEKAQSAIAEAQQLATELN